MNEAKATPKCAQKEEAVPQATADLLSEPLPALRCAGYIYQAATVVAVLLLLMFV